MCTGAENGAGFRQVTLLGLGVMGASLGLALKRLASPPRVVGFSRSAATRRTAADLGAVDCVYEQAGEAVAGSDLVVGCLPILALTPAFSDVLPELAPDVLLTDVGSTKQWLDDHIRPLLRISPAVYIGSHPMTGTEQSGPQAARADLYTGAAVFLTPASDVDPALVGRLHRFWSAVGARVQVVSSAEHDRCAARTSHLPHLAAAALVAAAFRGDVANLAPFIGPGFRDTTRVAGGSAEVWHDIVFTNREALLLELAAFEGIVGELRQRLEAGDFDGIRDFLDQMRCRRASEVLSACAP